MKAHHDGADHQTSDRDLVPSAFEREDDVVRDRTQLELADAAEVVDEKDDFVRSVVLVRKECALRVGCVDDVVEHLFDELGRGG